MTFTLDQYHNEYGVNPGWESITLVVWSSSDVSFNGTWGLTREPLFSEDIYTMTAFELDSTSYIGSIYLKDLGFLHTGEHKFEKEYHSAVTLDS